MKLVLLLAFSLWFIAPAGAQTPDDNAFSQLLQQYHSRPDPELLSKTIQYLNTTATPAGKLEPLLLGFFGALVRQDTIIGQVLRTRLNEVRPPDLRRLFTSLPGTNVDSLYAQSAPGPVLNDMNWASYFATGNPRYLNNLLGYTRYYEQRKDLTRFLAASSAMWSLAANARQDPAVHDFLAASKNPHAALALRQDPAYFLEQMPIIIRKNHQQGNWNKSTYPK